MRRVMMKRRIMMIITPHLKKNHLFGCGILFLLSSLEVDHNTQKRDSKPDHYHCGRINVMRRRIMRRMIMRVSKRQNSQQQVKHTNLYFELLQNLKVIAFANSGLTTEGTFKFCICSTPSLEFIKTTEGTSSSASAVQSINHHRSLQKENNRGDFSSTSALPHHRNL